MTYIVLYPYLNTIRTYKRTRIATPNFNPFFNEKIYIYGYQKKKKKPRGWEGGGHKRDLCDSALRWRGGIKPFRGGSRVKRTRNPQNPTSYSFLTYIEIRSPSSSSMGMESFSEESTRVAGSGYEENENSKIDRPSIYSISQLMLLIVFICK